MTAPFKILTAEGDRWLDRATDSYRGGGFAVGAVEAAIASAHYARAALEKPDTLASLLQAQQLAAVAQARQQGGQSGRPAAKSTKAAAPKGARAGRNGMPAPRAGRGSTKRITK